MPLDEPLNPVNLRVAGWRCLIGAGAVAADKIPGLLDSAAEVDVAAIDVALEGRDEGRFR